MPLHILVVALGWLALLIASFILFERWDAFADAVQFKLGRLPFEAIWFGAVGGLLISLQGIFDHNKSWHRSYDYWHMLRPVLGAVMGTLGCLIFIVLTDAATKTSSTANPVFYDVVALAIGYREGSFRALLERLVDTIILPPDSKSTSDKGQEAPPADSH
jgi:ABC-type Mn2+/Zn2+ transport system permease subunit